MKRACYVVIYYGSWLLFGSVGILLNLVCAVLLLMPRREAFGRTVRLVIRLLFDVWMRWLGLSRVVRVSWHGFDHPIEGGTVVVANHPSLIDATVILARMHDAICIFKPRIMRNPALGPAAIMAGYAAGDSGVDTIRVAAEKVTAGRSLLVFPEGTRTHPGETLGPLKAGFALIASRARAPVQLVILQPFRDLVPRGTPWWKLPRTLPSHFRVTLDRRWEHDPARNASALTEEVRARMLEALGTGRKET